MEKYAVIVAGGSGSRMNSKLPKQFIEIGSLPVLMHTISQFFLADSNMNIILVLPENQIDTWYMLCGKFQFSTQKITIVKGGSTRYQSCKNGIMSIPEEEALVAVHDAVRPFVNPKIINEGFQLALEKGAAICAVESKDSVRVIFPDGSNNAIERKTLRLIQTPQIFQLKILKKAYQVEDCDKFTDDASVVEAAGYPVFLYEGSYHNIKITTNDDLALAEVLLASDLDK
jgi:2-C-methyl-D-erythritol 4-phosphate cytidylyltransferase